MKVEPKQLNHYWIKVIRKSNPTIYVESIGQTLINAIAIANICLRESGQDLDKVEKYLRENPPNSNSLVIPWGAFKIVKRKGLDLKITEEKLGLMRSDVLGL